jgi:putative ABC transport system permease protein
LITAVLFSILPLRHVFRIDLQRVLHTAVASNGKAKTSRRLLVVSEVALACALTAGSFLLIVSFLKMIRADAGFRTANVLTLRLELPDSQYPEDHQKVSFYQELLKRIESLPSVDRVAAINLLPATGVFMQGLSIEGRPEASPADRPITAFRVVTSEYFSTLSIPVLQGRTFNESDRLENSRVAIIDKSTAENYWPDQMALGKRLSFEGTEGPWLTVVGVVGNARYHGIHKDFFPTVYVPHAQMPFAGMMLSIRTQSKPSEIMGDIRRIVAGFNSDLPIYKMMSFEDLLSRSIAVKRFPVVLIGIFAGLALFLAVLGVYGIVAYTARQRTREIGIRRAIGATDWNILRLIVREGMLLTVAGLLTGTLLAIFLKRFLSSLLVTSSSAAMISLSFLLMALLVLAVAFFASYLPARRALKIDPNAALRYE